MDMLKQTASLFSSEPKKKEWYEELEDEVCSFCPSLTYQQRLGGCLFCMILGFLISMGSIFKIAQLIGGNPTPFAITYTIGNTISICSTCFLYGPWTQAKKMFAATRFVTTCIYLFLMTLTLFLAFSTNFYIPGRPILIIISIFLQFLALSWYTISFIPFARDIVRNCLMNYCCCCCPSSEVSGGAGGDYWGLPTFDN